MENARRTSTNVLRAFCRRQKPEQEVNCPATVFYKVFANLAYGRYRIEVLQKDATGNELVSNGCRITIDDPFTKLGKELSNQLGAVKSQVAASGKNTVSW